MKRMKQTACLILTVICLALLPLTSFADEMTDQYVSAMQGVAGSLIPTTMAYEAGEELDANIAYAEAAGDTVGAKIYSDWAAVVGETGVFQSIGDIDAGVNDDGTFYANTTVACEKKNVDVKIVVNSDFTDVVSMTFDVQRTFGEKMKNAALNLLLGMGTVFIVLVFLMFIIGLFKYVPGIADKLTGKKKAAPAAPAAPVQAAPAAPAPAVQDDSELVAVIAAAIAAYEGTSADGLIVRSIRRVNKSSWKR